MPDTSEPRRAISHARSYHRRVMGHVSMAELKLLAAGGKLPAEDVIKPNDPQWLRDARTGLTLALVSCDALRAAVEIAKERVEELIALVPAEDGWGAPCTTPTAHRADECNGYHLDACDT